MVEVGKILDAHMMLVENIARGGPYAFVPIITTYSIICEYNLLEESEVPSRKERPTLG